MSLRSFAVSSTAPRRHMSGTTGSSAPPYADAASKAFNAKRKATTFLFISMAAFHHFNSSSHGSASES